MIFEILFKVVLLSISLFIPGYFLLVVIPKIITRLSDLISKKQIKQNYASSQIQLYPNNKKNSLINYLENELTIGEKIACSFALSIFLIVNLSFIIGILDLGLSNFYQTYFLISIVLLIIFFVIKRNYITQSLSNLIYLRIFSSSSEKIKQRFEGRFKFNWIYIFPIILFSIPLFHLYAFTKLNWDAFVYFLRDALAMQVSNSIQLHYPDSIHPNDSPFIFFSYLTSSLQGYSLEILDLFSYANENTTMLMISTTNFLSYLPLVTLFVSVILLGTFAFRIFKETILVVSSIIIFIMMPLLNHFFYIWSLYADLFF